MAGPPRPAIQLYSLREFSDPLPEVIRRVADAGFEGVEFANRFREDDPREIAAVLAETGIEPVAAHAELGVIEAATEGHNDLFNRCSIVGCDRLVIPHIPPRHFRSPEAVRSLSYRLSDLAATLRESDLKLGYHTMRHDVRPMLPAKIERLFDLTLTPDRVADYTAELLGRGRHGLSSRRQPTTPPSRTGLWNLFARTAPENLFFELESAEVQAGGFDPAETLSLFGGRVPLVHLRDVAQAGRFGEYQDVPHGEGAVDFNALVRAALDAGVEWFVYEDELDRSPEARLEVGAAFLDRLLDGNGGAGPSGPVSVESA